MILYFSYQTKCTKTFGELLMNLWKKEELIVALNLYWQIPYNKISGTSNPKIQELAKIIGRTPAALAYKLMNFTSLDNERQRKGNKGKENYGKLDEIIWNVYFNQWEKLSYDSALILSELQNKPVYEILKLDKEFDKLKGEEKERLIKTRVNQNSFRQRILASYNEKCCITGIDIASLLIASHIIPWAKNEQERLNPKNGICLNAIHDKAFDTGLISITPEYKILLSEKILSKKSDFSIQSFFIKYANEKITLPDRYSPDKEFLAWHNKNIFNG